MQHSEAAVAYIRRCSRDNAQCATELVQALDQNAKVAALGQRAEPLTDKDVVCIADVVRRLGAESALRVLNMEGNAFGIAGVQAIMDAVEANPHHIRELRLGRNNLKDEAVVVLGHALARGSCGLKVLDLSENGITRLGVIPIATALQRSACEIVELSLHNNRLEADAAPHLADLIRQSPRLKHLHLGYNALRDAGVAQLAQSLPLSSNLSTLDLTGNRVTGEGGAALARALLDPRCKLQRLNLRHNALDSATVALFADVAASNSSLIQLFLGFMNPSPEAATKVITALRHNHSLLLLDIFGWKLPSATLLALIADIQRENTCITAIVTDACAAIASEIAAGNRARTERDLHPIYVGADDRDAYLATKSLRRYSRAQSRRASRASSRRANSRMSSRHRAASRTSTQHSQPPQQKGPQPLSPRHDENTDTADVRTAPAHAAMTARTTGGKSAPTNGSLDALHSNHTASATTTMTREQKTPRATAKSPTSTTRGAGGRADGVRTRSATSRSPSRRSHGGESEVERLLAALHDDTPCDPRTATAIENLVRALQGRIRKQHDSLLALTGLVEQLTQRKECQCAATATTTAATHNGHCADDDNAATHPPRADNDDRAGEADVNAAGWRTQLHNGTHNSQKLSTITDFAARQSFTRSQSAGAYLDASNLVGTHGVSPFARTSSAVNPPLHGAQTSPAHRFSSMYFLKRSASAQSETEPMSSSMTRRDVPPSLARANDVSGDWRPEEASLQRSVVMQNFPPRIEPSPAQDANPPRRKSMAHYI